MVTLQHSRLPPTTGLKGEGEVIKGNKGYSTEQ